MLNKKKKKVFNDLKCMNILYLLISSPDQSSLNELISDPVRRNKAVKITPPA